MEEIKSEPVVFAVGDTVIARWLTPKKQLKKIRGHVVEVKPNKVKIKYLKVSGGSGINMSVLTVWRPIEQVKKVKRKEGEQDASELLKNIVEVMAGKEPTPGPGFPKPPAPPRE